MLGKFTDPPTLRQEGQQPAGRDLHIWQERFAAEVRAANERAVVVLDNVGHHKSHALREVWRRYANRLEPFFLPGYAPQLNLIERLWRYLKLEVVCIAGETISTAWIRRSRRCWPL